MKKEVTLIENIEDTFVKCIKSNHPDKLKCKIFQYAKRNHYGVVNILYSPERCSAMVMYRKPPKKKDRKENIV